MKWQKVVSSLFFTSALLLPVIVQCHDDPEVDEKDVSILTKATFDESIKKLNHTLVMFYAPWCGHCKNLFPHFAGAATALKENPKLDGAVGLAKVDATVDTDLGTKYDVKAYPTLKFFSKDGTHTDYNGGRTKETIIAWLETMMGPSVTTATEKEVEAEMGKGIFFVARVKTEDSDAYKLYAKIAAKRRLQSKFMAVIGDSNKDTITVYRPEEKAIEGPIGKNQEKLDAWIDTKKFPLFGPIDGDNFGQYEERGWEIVWFAGKKSDYEANGKEIRGAADGLEYSFVWVDTEKFGSYVEGGLGITDLPGLVLRQKEGARYVFPKDKKMVSKEIASFMKDVAAGKVEKLLKSEPIPETNDEAVKVVVGKNFEEMVFRQDKDVMLEVYAPWCGHCKRLEPIYSELAGKLLSYKHVVIAKMDGNANEPSSNDFNIRGFPTLFWVKAGSKTPETYAGARTLEGMLTYIKEHSSKPIDIEVEKAPEVEGEEEEAKDEL